MEKSTNMRGNRGKPTHHPFQLSTWTLLGYVAIAALIFSWPGARRQWWIGVVVLGVLVIHWLLEESEKKYRENAADHWYPAHAVWRASRIVVGILSSFEIGFVVALSLFLVTGSWLVGVVALLGCAILGAVMSTNDSYRESPRNPKMRPSSTDDDDRMDDHDVEKI